MLQVRPIVNATKSIRIATIRAISSTSSCVTSTSTPFPITSRCPSPTCTCAKTPAGLDIDREKNLSGSMAPYAQHVVISTGKSDWTSRIEVDGQGTPWGDFGRQLKAMLGRGGKYSDPFNNIMITNSSFAGMTTGAGVEALLLPSFEVMHIRKLDPTVTEKFVREHLLPETLHPMHSGLSDAHKTILTRKPRSSTSEPVYNLTRPTILICSHNSRDTRCGVMGPILQSEFVRQLQRLEYMPSTEHTVNTSSQDIQMESGQPEPESFKVNVGLISHIGGHKWAGNVIIYIPPTWAKDGKPMTSKEQKSHPSPLAGCGIWYGRVEPKHVEGIIKKTIQGGTVIKELFRGGIEPNSEVLRLPF